jgi:16S rRNA C1402 (ribose-2'-O) methylase RsmI
MTILLDIDGVLVTTPSWKTVEQHEDGFMKFNEEASRNLAELLRNTGAQVVLTTTHRITHSVDKWIDIFRKRGIPVTKLTKLNALTAIEEMKDRGAEILEWAQNIPVNSKYVILDDDLSINNLPNQIKDKWVKTQSLIGFNKECLEQAIKILQGN